LQAFLGHRSIQSTVRYTELAPDRFKNLWPRHRLQYPLNVEATISIHVRFRYGRGAAIGWPIGIIIFPKSDLIASPTVRKTNKPLIIIYRNGRTEQ
ncbi:MAG: hypothetical protein WBX77_23365, partial [Pseudolabrys sp.]